MSILTCLGIYIFDSYMDNKQKTYQFADVAYDVVF